MEYYIAGIKISFKLSKHYFKKKKLWLLSKKDGSILEEKLMQWDMFTKH